MNCCSDTWYCGLVGAYGRSGNTDNNQYDRSLHANLRKNLGDFK